jgi:hypothetical protein
LVVVVVEVVVELVASVCVGRVGVEETILAQCFVEGAFGGGLVAEEGIEGSAA